MSQYIDVIKMFAAAGANNDMLAIITQSYIAENGPLTEKEAEAFREVVGANVPEKTNGPR